MFSFKTIKETDNFKGKRVVARFDFNVPIAGGRVADDFRIMRSIPTLKLLSSSGARTIAISHIENSETKSLSLVHQKLNEFLPVSFARNLEEAFTLSENLHDGGIVLLENIRNYPEEKKNDEKFAKRLSSLGDIYINEAFAVSHRKHASVVGIPRFIPSYAGLLFAKEVKYLARAFNPAHPFLVVLSGAKFETKIPLVKKFIKIADDVFIGGILANTLIRSLGKEIGNSIVSDKPFDWGDVREDKKLHVPVDVLVETVEKRVKVKQVDDVKADDIIRDVGPETLSMLRDIINKTSFVLWNGPLGFYEHGFSGGTEKFAAMIGRKDCESVIGGGDTRAAVQNLKLEDSISFISTGGGAMLQFLAEETLPGIEALEVGMNI